MVPSIVQPVQVAVKEGKAPPDMAPSIVQPVQALPLPELEHPPPVPASPKAGTSGTLPRRNNNLSEKHKRQIFGEDSDVESNDDATYKPDQACQSDESNHQTSDKSDEETPLQKKARKVIY